MRQVFLVGLVALVKCSPAPQYSGQTQDLTGDQIDTIKDIFGSEAGGAYSGEQTGKLNDASSSGVEVIVQVVKDGTEYVAPDDYYKPETGSLIEDKATTVVDQVFDNCADYTESQGYECVPYYQCHNGTIITDGEGLIDIRNGFGILSPEDSKCPGFLDVCCLDPDFIAPPVTIKKHEPKCGQRHENGLGVRIQGFNDYESQFGEWPHMCAILAEEPVAAEPGYGGEPQTINLYQCGGSLIAPGVILTAAHCAEKFASEPSKLKIRCGEWDTQNQTEPRPHQDRYVSDLAIHPEFSARNLNNDWAVLFTSEPFELQQHIDTICLPEPEELFDGQNCFATGWGKDKFGAAGEYQVVLKEIGLPVVGHDQCQDSLRQTRLGRRYKLHDSFICAGGEDGKDTCKGDGGSPLVCSKKNDPNTYVQAGIVAWGIGCGEDNTPGVYASVSKAACWIDYAMSCYYGPPSPSTSLVSSYWGFSSQQCQGWMDSEFNSINERLAVLATTGSLRGRAKGAALAAGLAAQKASEYYSQCTVAWVPSPRDTAPFTEGEGGYGDGGQVDISNLGLERDSYPTAPLTDGTDGSYSEDSSSAVKITEDTYTGDNAPLTSGDSSYTGDSEKLTSEVTDVKGGNY